jgi:hypothetical protein
MSVRKALFILIAMVCIALLAIIFSVSLAPRSFLGLRFHQQSYFANISMGCEELFVRHSGEPGKQRIKGDDPSLPRSIRELHPTYVLVNEVGVLIQMRTKFDSYSIQWHNVDNGRWQLEAVAEGSRYKLFWTNKTVSAELLKSGSTNTEIHLQTK